MLTSPTDSLSSPTPTRRTAILLKNVVYRPASSEFELVIREWRLLAGEKVALTGRSGSGKTTLLGLISGRLLPQTGTVHVLEQDLTTLSTTQREHFRLQKLGIVFQDFRLINYLTVAENITLKNRLSSSTLARGESRERLQSIAARLKLEPLLQRYPGQLSQGEKQRTAIGRAMWGEPQLLIADEPTGNLDQLTARQTLDFLLEAATATDASLLVVTHDRSLLPSFDRHIDLLDLQ